MSRPLVIVSPFQLDDHSIKGYHCKRQRQHSPCKIRSIYFQPSQAIIPLARKVPMIPSAYNEFLTKRNKMKIYLLSVDIVAKLDFLVVLILHWRYNTDMIILIHQKMKIRIRAGGSSNRLKRYPQILDKANLKIPTRTNDCSL